MSQVPQNRKKSNSGPKISRVVWNKNGWQSPSGPACKSPNAGNHEHDFGYGYEEWLLDTGKQWEGYQYGFLQPFNQAFHKYTGQLFPDIYLYTINACTKVRYWVAHLRDVEILTQAECSMIDNVYEKQGWKRTMRQQIRQAANQPNFSNYHNERLAHLQFKPVAPYNNGQLIAIDKKHPVYRLNRFKLYDATGMDLPL